MWSFISLPGRSGLVSVSSADFVGGGDGCHGGRGGAGRVHRVAPAEGDELAPVGTREVEDRVFGGGLGHVRGPDIHGQCLAVYDVLPVNLKGDSRGATYNIPTLRTPPPPYAVLRLPRGRVRAAPARPPGRSHRSPRSTRSRTWRRTCPPVLSAGRERSPAHKPGPPHGGRERIGCWPLSGAPPHGWSPHRDRASRRCRPEAGAAPFRSTTTLRGPQSG